MRRALDQDLGVPKDPPCSSGEYCPKFAPIVTELQGLTFLQCVVLEPQALSEILHEINIVVMVLLWRASVWAWCCFQLLASVSTFDTPSQQGCYLKSADARTRMSFFPLCTAGCRLS